MGSRENRIYENITNVIYGYVDFATRLLTENLRRISSINADMFPLTTHTTNETWEVINKEAEVIIHLDIPRAERDSLNVTIRSDKLVVTANKKVTTENDSEHTTEKFRKLISLPPNLSANKATASYTEGHLTVKIPIEDVTRVKII